MPSHTVHKPPHLPVDASVVLHEGGQHILPQLAQLAVHRRLDFTKKYLNPVGWEHGSQTGQGLWGI